MEMSTTTTKRRKKEHYHGNVSKYQHVQIISIYIISLLFVCLFDWNVPFILKQQIIWKA